MQQQGIITDPEDFLKSKVPELSNLDTLLRCDICKEFYNSPVLSTCGHSFCSLCIRRYLATESKCALCGRELRESGLKRNGVLEELVSVFVGLRYKLVESLTIEKEVDNDEENEEIEETINDEVEIIDLDEVPMDYDDDNKIEIIKDVKKRKSPVGLDMLLKKKQKPDIETQTKKNVEMAECPICSKILPLDILQSTHIDSCLANPSPPPPSPPVRNNEVKKSSIISSRPNTPKQQQQPVPRAVQPNNINIQKLPKLDLTLPTPQLKTKLHALELPTTGTRAILEQRYIEYSTLWNANCDSGKPKDARVLRRELNRWENLVLRDLENKKDGKNKKEKEIITNKDDWKDLLKQAKETRNKKNEVDKENKASDITNN